MQTLNYSKENSKYNLIVNIGELSSGNVLYGRNVLVTGGTRGIGLCIAKKCIKQGANVIITGRKEADLIAVENYLGIEHCKSYLLDVNDIQRFPAFLDEVTQYFGPIDSIVHNAGISLHEGTFSNVDEQSWDRQMNTNLKAPYFLTQAWLDYYESSGLKNGRIVMMASDTSGMGSTLPYGLSKVAISSFVRGLAKHVIRKGIRINAIAPGTTRTQMTEDFTHGEMIRESTEGNRVLFPEEIAEVCVFLLSNAAACISGNVFGCSEANICFDNVTNAFCGELETNP